jgi:hypothetical protein
MSGPTPATATVRLRHRIAPEARRGSVGSAMHGAHTAGPGRGLFYIYIAAGNYLSICT